ncbi:hypothetical protein G7Y79_00002g007730 [Physcia stellaris]|nr:hypothetical protein G7Y79_00002g007730 [Physcia stellaris]
MLVSQSSLAALTAFFALASAHVKIESPVPYGAGNAAPAIDTNPLRADGSDYPCKQRLDVYKVVKNNVMAIGEPQPLTFQGQATHGGGSCQIALSKDMQPTKSSVFKVILSIEGGCPSKNPGNVGNDPFGYGADKFQYTIPAEVSPGDYTLAFTWFNKIGQREMYMNCAPITVTGSAKSRRNFFDDAENNNDTTIFTASDSDFDKRDAFSSLPDMFKANIGNGCSTAESGTDLAIPEANKGKYVQRYNTGPLTPPVGNCASSGAGAAAADPVPVAPAAAQPSAHRSSAAAVQPSPSASVPDPVPENPHPTATETVTVTATAPAVTVTAGGVAPQATSSLGERQILERDSALPLARAFALLMARVSGLVCPITRLFSRRYRRARGVIRLWGLRFRSGGGGL